jgi:hypothetical protein
MASATMASARDRPLAASDGVLPFLANPLCMPLGVIQQREHRHRLQLGGELTGTVGRRQHGCLQLTYVLTVPVEVSVAMFQP